MGNKTKNVAGSYQPDPHIPAATLGTFFQPRAKRLVVGSALPDFADLVFFGSWSEVGH